MKFTKMHGCGNDYVYVNAMSENIPEPDKLAPLVSDRHFGIGSDGLILICDSEIADFRMRMFNADGTESEMCGNGVRCVAKYVYDNGLTDQTHVAIETGGGIKYLDLKIKDGQVDTVTVDMGEPGLSAADVPVLSEEMTVVDEPLSCNGIEYRITCVNMGNPHAVIFVDDVEAIDIEKVGPPLENHPAFPERANIEFIQVVNRSAVKMRVWERGSGETLACGTGACASVMACILNEKTTDRVTVHLLGGDLDIEYNRNDEHIYMTGPARTVFTGEIDTDRL